MKNFWNWLWGCGSPQYATLDDLKQLEKQVMTNKESWEAVATVVNESKQTLLKLKDSFKNLEDRLEVALEKPEDAATREATVLALQDFSRDLSAFADAQGPVVPPPIVE